MNHTYKIPLSLSPQPDGGYTITSSLIPELISEGDTLAEALANVNDALQAVIELYEDLNRPLPSELHLASSNEIIEFEALLSVS